MWKDSWKIAFYFFFMRVLNLLVAIKQTAKTMKVHWEENFVNHFYVTLADYSIIHPSLLDVWYRFFWFWSISGIVLASLAAGPKHVKNRSKTDQSHNQTYTQLRIRNFPSVIITENTLEFLPNFCKLITVN